jgi:uncharacterized protein
MITMDKSKINKLRESIIQTIDQENFQCVSHKFDHAERVYTKSLNLAKTMGKSWEIDTEILEAAALLHDIDQPYNDKQNHVERSAKLAEKLLKEVGYSEDKIKKIVKVILEHSSEEDVTPTTPESKILFYADKFDSLGAIGIARVFALCGQRGLTPNQAILWYKKKIEKAKGMIRDEYVKKLIEKELAYVESFFEKYEQEQKP